MVESFWGAAAAGLVGWLWGSFLNQLADRTPRSGASPSPPPGGSSHRPLSLLYPPRSLCLGCGAPIPWRDNVPVLSYLLLGGLCRHCGAAIGRRTLLVEILTPLLFMAIHRLLAASSPLAIGPAFALASWLLVGAVLLLEGRRKGPAFWIAGAAAAALMAITVLL